MPTTSIAVIVAGGESPPAAAIASLPDNAIIIAADSGLDHVLAAGLHPDLLVGDLDSVSNAALEWARTAGIPIQEFSPDKDATDTELAIAAALAMGAEQVILLGGGGDRLDHSIGAITALGNTSLAACTSVSARWGTAEIHMLHGPRAATLAVRIGATFSLLALHGTCTGVELREARWPLTNAELHPGSSLGVSNTTTASELHVQVQTGVLTVVFPDQFVIAVPNPTGGQS